MMSASVAIVAFVNLLLGMLLAHAMSPATARPKEVAGKEPTAPDSETQQSHDSQVTGETPESSAPS